METNIKTLETNLAERNAAIRILQSKNSSSNLSVNNIDEFISTKMAAAAAAAAAASSQPPDASGGSNVVNIPINSHKKQLPRLGSVA